MSQELARQGEERSLESQKGIGVDLATSESRSMLYAVHFSKEFPARVLRINEAFKSIAPDVESISITLVPGNTPMIDAKPSYSLGYFVGIKSDRLGRATLKIQALTEYTIHRIWGVYTERLQAFIADIAPDKEARIHAEPNSGFKEKIEPLNMSITEVTDEVLEEISKDYEMEDWEDKIRTFAGLYQTGSFEIRLEGQEDPMFKLTLCSGHTTKENRPFFQIQEMHYSGHTNQVEAVMDKVVDHLFVPASPKEVPETQV